LFLLGASDQTPNLGAFSDGVHKVPWLKAIPDLIIFINTTL